MGKYFEFIEKYESSLSPLAVRSQDARRLDGTIVDLDNDKNLEKGYRTPFQLDRDRVLYSKYFDLLARKTQIFIAPEKELLKNGPFRNRLTHTHSCANLARSIAVVLRLNEPLVEAIALGHDIGHTPYGHSGEKALRKITNPEHLFAKVLFMHGRQGLRLLTLYQGENLTKHVACGIATHSLSYNYNNNKIPVKGILWNRIENPIKFMLDENYDSFEAQVVRITDDIAWICDDYRDALSSELITENYFVEKIKLQFRTETYIRILAGNLYTYFMNNIINTNMGRLNELEKKQTTKDVFRTYKIDFDTEGKEIFEFLKEEIDEKIHNHDIIIEKDKNREEKIEDIYNKYFKTKKSMLPFSLEKDLPEVPKEIKKVKEKNDISTQQIFCDYISMLSDDKVEEIWQKIKKA